jgi:hypothetical protein
MFARRIQVETKLVKTPKSDTSESSAPKTIRLINLPQVRQSQVIKVVAGSVVTYAAIVTIHTLAEIAVTNLSRPQQ